MIKSILLSVDGSIYTEAVLRNGIHLAKALEARLRVLSVIDVRTFEWAMSLGADGFVPVIPSSAYLEESRKLHEEKAQAVLEKSREILQQENVAFELEKASGSPIDVICEQARTVDLIIMGARGEFARWESKMIGATLEAVSRQVNKPILIVSKEFKPFTKILAAYDGSPTANKALGLAGYFANKLALPVIVLTVSNKEEEAKQILDEGVKYVSSYDVKVESKQVKGTPHQMICEFAHDNGVDLIIMGAYGGSRIKEAILGSTTESVMRKSRVPVLLAK